MTVHTFRNLQNEKYFPKEQEVFINQIRDCALTIQRLCWRANNIKVDNIQTRYQDRMLLQDRAADLCNDMMDLLETAKMLFHLPGRKTAYWIGEYSKLRAMIRGWHNEDAKRLKPNG